MIKVYICPRCGWMRTVSRRKYVECFKCREKNMELTKMTYEKYAFLSEDERLDYANSWIYIHKKKDK